MPLITLQGVSKAYDDNRPLLTKVDLTVTSQDRIGLIGPNGAGKSTLLKMMAGVDTLDSGTRVLRNGLRIGYLEQEPVFDNDLTIEDAVREGLSEHHAVQTRLFATYEKLADGADVSDRIEDLEHQLERLGGHDVEHKIAASIHGVGLKDASLTCGNLSGGEARRVALAKLLVSAPDLMLLDEPTNHLDAFVIAWLEKQLTQMKVPLVLVTHDRFLLDRVVNKIVEVDRGSIYSYPGNYNEYLRLRIERIASQEKSENTRLALLKRETAWMRAGVLGRGTKANARIKRFDALASSKSLESDVKLEMEIPRGPRLGSKVIEIENLRFAYPEKKILNGLDLKIENGMRLGIVGPNGVGKTTLIKLLLGQLEPDGGSVTIGETVKFGTLEQKREDLDDEATVMEEIAGTGKYVVVGESKVHIAGFLNSFLFPGAKKLVKVGSLSGGERGRVLLAKLLLQDCNVLVLDEPTNDLDLNTLRALEEALCAFYGCVLLVSHDRWFLDRVATHVLYLDDRGGAFLHTGDVSSLLDRWSPDEGIVEQVAEKMPVMANPEGKKSTSKRKLNNKERLEFDGLLDEVTTIEKEMATLDSKLSDPEIYATADKQLAVLQKRRAELEALIVAKTKRWEELSEFSD
ncbi:MAG: ABC-F family ATP-binding cassette domain-containing protein [Planctomycetota bacterium]|nr:ABC-F family ATP-binding cassette domain-containing protein [Planctomycetota bacterium]MDG2309646.1 ABC-F family ATP-binding cassette domain-containing protein [Planctomycetota bacterium]